MPPHPQEFGPFTFDAPDEWSRRPLLLFAGPSSAAGPGPSVLVTRDHRAPGEDLQAYAWRRLFEITRASSGRELGDARATRLGDRPAFRAQLKWTTDGGTFREALAWVDAGDGNVLVVTWTGPADAGIEPFEQLLGSLRVAGTPPVSGVIPTPSSSFMPTPAPSAHRSTPPPPPDLDMPQMFPSVPMPGPRAQRR
jgi:hypothetical protein